MQSMSGYVLLIQRDGTIAAVETSGMNAGALVWDAQGLFFSDTQRDYLMTSAGTTMWESPKADLQVAAYVDQDGQHVGIYNLGWDHDSDLGYVEQVVTTSAAGVSRYDVAGFSYVTAQCESRVFSIAEAVGPYTSVAQSLGATQRDYAPYWPDTLTQVFPKPETVGDAFVSFMQDGTGGNPPVDGATCRNNQILSVTDHQTGTPQPPSITVWPVDGHKPSEHTIVDLQGESPDVEDQVATSGTVADWSPSPDQLVWLGGDGIVRSTSINDGTSTQLWDSGTRIGTSEIGSVTFVGSSLYILDHIGGRVRLRVHDLATDATKEMYAGNLGYKDTDTGLVPQGLAIAPDEVSH